MGLSGGGWSWVEVGARFSNTPKTKLIMFFLFKISFVTKLWLKGTQLNNKQLTIAAILRLLPELYQHLHF